MANQSSNNNKPSPQGQPPTSGNTPNQDMEQYKKIISQIAGNLQAFNTAVANATGKLNNVQPAQSNADREQTGMGKPFINCHIHKAPSYKAA